MALNKFIKNNVITYKRRSNINLFISYTRKIFNLKCDWENHIFTATQILDVIHSDVMGPISITSWTGKRYILTFIDEFSRKSWIFLLEDKKEVPRITINFFTYLKVQFKHDIKSFHTDHGTEYENRKILNYCKKHGIVKTYSPPHSPQNNGLAERFNYTIANCARTLLRWAKMSLEFWDYAMNYANTLYNITPHKGIKNQIPNEIFYKKKVELKYLKVFGCIAYYKDYSQKNVKVGSKGLKGVFLGFNNESHCYIIMDLTDYRIHLVNEVVFEEQSPSALKAKGLENNSYTYNNILNNDNYITEYYTINNDKSSNESINHDVITYNENTSNNDNNDKLDSTSNKYVIKKFDNSRTIDDNSNSLISNNSTSVDDDNQIVKNSNKRKHSVYSNPDSDNDNVSSNENDSIPIKRIDIKSYSPNILPLKRKNKNDNKASNKKYKTTPKELIKRPGSPVEPKSTKRPKFILENVEKLNNRQFTIYSCTFSNGNNKIIIDIPLTYKQAISCKHSKYWISAMKSEIKNFYDNDVMTFLKHLPRGAKPTSVKWVYSIKKDENGNLVKFKARLVARGFTQKKGVNYELTYSPTLSLDSLKLIIALASKFKWNLMQLDIKAAYLNAPLDKDIYIPVPPGDNNFGKGYWLLKKALYGLKQSGRQWHIHFTNFLNNNNFIQLLSEPCIFKKMVGGKVVCIIGIYVDDLLITGTKSQMNSIISKIKKNFKISKCSQAKYILGINIEKEKTNYSISQTLLIDEILQKFNITNIRKSKTPCTNEGKLSEKNNKPFDVTTFKSAVGSLIYLSRCTRPDIAYAVGRVARNSENPSIGDWKKVINIMKYLNYTKNYKITYKGQGEIIAYTDSDFAGDPKDRKSTSGYIIMMNNDPICWQSKKQTVVATSTAEAEYIATSECTKKVLWLRNIIYELFKIKKPFKILTDNLASKTAIENGELNNKLKHIQIKFYFNKDNIINNRIKLEYINSEKMLADPLTKNINGPQMSKYTDQIFNKKTFWSEGEC